jgi:hypothetical protein
MFFILIIMAIMKESSLEKISELENNEKTDLTSLVEQFVFHDYIQNDLGFIDNDFGRTAKRLIKMIAVFADKTNGQFYVRLSAAYKKISFNTFDEDIANVLVKECKREILSLKTQNLSILKVFRELVFHMSLSSLFDAENYDLKIKAKFGWKITDFVAQFLYENFTDLLNRHRITDIAETPGLALWPSSAFRFDSEDEGETPGLTENFNELNLDDN